MPCMKGEVLLEVAVSDVGESLGLNPALRPPCLKHMLGKSTYIDHPIIVGAAWLLEARIEIYSSLSKGKVFPQI